MKDLFWFKFEPASFLIGTAEMTPEQVGGYIRLLCYDWEKDGLPDNMKAISQLSGLSESEAIALVSLKFRLSDDKRWRNERLHSQIAERRKLSEVNAENGKKGAEAKKTKRNASDRLATADDSPQRTDKRNVSILEIEKEKERNTHTHTPHERPKLEKVIEHGNMRGMLPAICTDYFNKRERDGWQVMSGGQLIPIVNWRADFDYIAPMMKADAETKAFKTSQQKVRSPAPSFGKERKEVNVEAIRETVSKIWNSNTDIWGNEIKPKTDEEILF